MNYVLFFPMTFYLTLYFLPLTKRIFLCLFVGLLLDVIVYSFPFYHCLTLFFLLFVSLFFEKKKCSRIVQIIVATILYYAFLSFFLKECSFPVVVINLVYNVFFTLLFFMKHTIKV